MSVIRVNKTKDFTVMSNRHFRDRRLSLKAKGLLSQMLSLPASWDYTVAGLVVLNRESKAAIQSALKELEEAGYLIRTRTQNAKGQFDYIYDIYEAPRHGEPRTENRVTENPCTENQPQYNTNNKILKNKITDNKERKKGTRTKYGEYKNILLSDEQLDKLKEEFPNDWQERIEAVSAYCESTGKTYKNYLATIRNWAKRDAAKNKPKLAPGEAEYIQLSTEGELPF